MKTLPNTDIDVMHPESLSLENRAAAFSVLIQTSTRKRIWEVVLASILGGLDRKGYLGAKDLKVS